MALIKILNSRVNHRRKIPKKNEFSYRVFYLHIPIIKDMSYKTPALFSFNKFNVLSVKFRDYGKKADNENLYDFIQDQIKVNNIKLPEDYDISMITHPRIFGYAFNPITYFLITNQDKLYAVLAEVHNTFKQTHNYLIHNDGKPLKNSDIKTAQKQLYVSPYTKMKGHYEFSFTSSKDEFISNIDFFEEGNLRLETQMKGTYSEIDNLKILNILASYPLMTVMIVVRIHYQALKLLIKKVPLTLKIRPKKYKNDQTTKGN